MLYVNCQPEKKDLLSTGNSCLFDAGHTQHGIVFVSSYIDVTKCLMPQIPPGVINEWQIFCVHFTTV